MDLRRPGLKSQSLDTDIQPQGEGRIALSICFIHSQQKTPWLKTSKYIFCHEKMYIRKTVWFLFLFSRKKRKTKRKEGTRRKDGGGERNEWENNEKKKEKEKNLEMKEKNGKSKREEKRKTASGREREKREKREENREPESESAQSLPPLQAALSGTSPAAFKYWGCCPATDHHPKKWNVGFTSENFHLLFHQVKWNTEFKAQANDLCFLWDT